MKKLDKELIFWWFLIAVLVIAVSVLHYTTPTMKWQYHLIFMQSYFIPILIAAFQFGIKGGLGVAAAVSFIYFPHIMLQWGGLVEGNLMRFLQIFLFNVIGFLTGFLAQKEMKEKERYLQTARELSQTLEVTRRQGEQLELMEEQLRRADRLAVIGELTASLAHEVRNPLGSIRGTVEILRDELPPDAKTSEFFEILIKETERMSRVVENYLGFSRTQHDAAAEFDIREVINDVFTLLKGRAKRNQVRLEQEVPQVPSIVWGNPTELQQILVNLVLNAVQASGPGKTVQITLNEIEKEKLNETVHKKIPGEKGSINQVAVEDRGSGIQKENLQKIFQPFFTMRKEGTGLGLAIVKRLVDKNRWALDVESETGNGTRFCIYIPPGESK